MTVGFEVLGAENVQLVLLPEGGNNHEPIHSAAEIGVFFHPDRRLTDRDVPERAAPLRVNPLLLSSLID